MKTKKEICDFLEQVEATTQDKNTAVKIRKFMNENRLWNIPTKTIKSKSCK